MEALTTTNQQQITARIDQLIDRFLFEQDVKANSRQVYRNNMKAFFAWVQSAGHNLSDLTRVQILDYKTYLLQSGKSTLTVAGYLGTVRIFFEWCEGHKLYPNIAKGVRAPRDKKAFRKNPISFEQSIELMIHFNGKAGKSEAAARDSAVIHLLLVMGLRTIEVIRANIEDICFIDGRRVIMIQGKGWDEKNEAMELTNEAYEPIQRYLRMRGNPSRGPLFVSTSNNNRGQRLTTHSISYMAKAGLRAIGIDDKSVTAHSLRHTAAHNILRGGEDIFKVQGMLRHADIKTTMRYTAGMNQEMRLKDSGEGFLSRLYTEAIRERQTAA